MYNYRTRYRRIIAAVLCIIMLTGVFYNACPISEHAFGAQQKSITLYTKDWSTEQGSSDFDTAFGFDTLVTPAYATGWKITWKSSNSSVAEVDSRGRVLAKKEGTCVITATCTWGKQTATDSIKVTVKKGYDPSGTFFFNSADDPEVPDTDLSYEQEDSSDQTLSGTETADDASGHSKEIEQSLEHEHAEGEMLVVFDKSTRNSEIKETLSEYDAGLEHISSLGENEKAALATAGSEEELKEVMTSLANDEKVAYVQPNYIYRLDDDGEGYDEAAGSSVSGTSLDSYEKDPEYDSQYFHKLMDTAGAWKLLDTNGISQTTIVGVVDSGVDASHPDLADNLILTDGKYMKFNGVFPTASDSDSVGHGTHVSGIIGEIYGNGLGGAGVASGPDNNYCRILPAGIVRGSGRNAEITTSDTINGINYVVENGARVVNMSFGSDVKDRAVMEVISDNYYSHGTVFVASGGNKTNQDLNDETNAGSTRLECMNFPGEMKEVISVCNIDSEGKKSQSSYSGLAKDVSAPGMNIYSTYPVSRYTTLSGTSMAAPMVSAVAALILDANPDLNAREVRNIICATSNGWNDYYKSNEIGYGRIDARACVEAAYKAREHAQSGFITDTGSTVSDKLGFSIKSYYNGEPEPFVLQQYVTKKKSKSISAVPSFGASAAKSKIKMTFGKASVITTTTTTTESQYYTRIWETETSKSKTSSTAGVKYQIRMKYGNSIRYYKTAAKNTTSDAYNVSVKGDIVKVTLKKFGTAKLASGSTYNVAVRAYKSIDGETKYGKWSKTVKVKVK